MGYRAENVVPRRAADTSIFSWRIARFRGALSRLRCPSARAGGGGKTSEAGRCRRWRCAVARLRSSNYPDSRNVPPAFAPGSCHLIPECGGEAGVVPRAPNFPLFASPISYLQHCGVQVELELV